MASEPQASNSTWLAAADLLQYLVERETKRWNGIEAAQGLAEGTLSHALAYCTVFDGLPIAQLRTALDLNDAAVKAMQAVMPHKNDKFLAMQPDLLAARFLSHWRLERLNLGHGNADVQSLLQLCSNNAKLSNLIQRWDMLAYDQHVRLELDRPNGIEALLIDACAKGVEFKTAINQAVSQHNTWNGLSQLATSSYQHDEGATSAQQAGALNNHAVDLANAGDSKAALSTAQRAVAIREKLTLASPAAYEPDLAMSLNNLANCYSSVGDHSAALSTAQRAVDIFKKYYVLHPAAFERSYTIAQRVLERLEAS